MGESSAGRSRVAEGAYWLFVAVLVGFGYLTGFSVGIPFLLLGVTLMCLAPFRGRPTVFWPPLVAVVGFLGGFVLTAPFACSATGTATTGGTVGVSPTTCRSIIGLTTSSLRPGTYRPSFAPALLIGVGTAIVLGLATWLLLSRRGTR